MFMFVPVIYISSKKGRKISINGPSNPSKSQSQITHVCKNLRLLCLFFVQNLIHGLSENSFNEVKTCPCWQVMKLSPKP
jgi:hypothetical protein